MISNTHLNKIKSTHLLVGAAISTMLLLAGAAQAQTHSPPLNYSYLCAEGEQCITPRVGVLYNIAYGVGPDVRNYYVRPAIMGTFKCGDSAVFNWNDPAKKQQKYCYISNQPSNLQYIAFGGQTGSVNQKEWVVYGVNGRYKMLEKIGSFNCDDKTFQDPARGEPKHCFIARGMY